MSGEVHEKLILNKNRFQTASVRKDLVNKSIEKSFEREFPDAGEELDVFREEYIRFYNSCDNSLFPIQGGFLLYQAPDISEYNSKTDPVRAKQIKEQVKKFFEIYLSE